MCDWFSKDATTVLRIEYISGLNCCPTPGHQPSSFYSLVVAFIIVISLRFSLLTPRDSSHLTLDVSSQTGLRALASNSITPKMLRTVFSRSLRFMPASGGLTRRTLSLHTTLAIDEEISPARRFLETRFQENDSLFAISVTRLGYYRKLYEKYCPGALDDSSAKALDIGSGPSFNPVIGLIPYVSNVVLSEYDEENRKEAQRWKEESPKAFDWRPFISAALTFSEHDQPVDDNSLQTRENEIRRKVSNIIPCDVRSKEIIDPKYVPDGGFDVVTSMGVLNVGASTKAEVYQALENIHSILNQGGLLFCYMSGKSTYYTMGSAEKYPLVYITDDDVKEALRKAKFDLKEFIIVPEFSPSCNHKELYLFVAQK